MVTNFVHPCYSAACCAFANCHAPMLDAPRYQHLAGLHHIVKGVHGLLNGGIGVPAAVNGIQVDIIWLSRFRLWSTPSYRFPFPGQPRWLRPLPWESGPFVAQHDLVPVGHHIFSAWPKLPSLVPSPSTHWQCQNS